MPAQAAKQAAHTDGLLLFGGAAMLLVGGLLAVIGSVLAMIGIAAVARHRILRWMVPAAATRRRHLPAGAGPATAGRARALRQLPAPVAADAS